MTLHHVLWIRCVTLRFVVHIYILLNHDICLLFLFHFVDVFLLKINCARGYSSDLSGYCSCCISNWSWFSRANHRWVSLTEISQTELQVWASSAGVILLLVTDPGCLREQIIADLLNQRITGSTEKPSNIPVQIAK